MDYFAHFCCGKIKNTYNFIPAMLRFPNCKINLGLYITNRRQDGYHDIETIFYPISVRDVLEVVPATVTALHISGREVAGDTTNNLVWKAYEMLQQQYPDKVGPMEIYLLKNIPMGAGLGGGSADGAFMLELVNSYCKLGLVKDELSKMALELGSDCPFFIYDTPQFAQGRGEQMTSVTLDLSMYSIQVICPDVHVATGKAFQMITPKPAAFDLRKINELPVQQWKEQVSNNFEAPIFGIYPVLGEIKAQLYQGGALYASMSGSGSAVYGIFEKGKRAGISVGVRYEEFYIE